MSTLVMVTIFALTYLSIQREQVNFRQELEEQADLLLETTSLSIRDQLYRIELDELRALAEAVRDNPNVTLFVIYDAQGKVLVDSTRMEMSFSQTVDPLGAKLVGLTAGEVAMDWQPQQLVAGRAVVLGRQTIGAIASGLSTRALDQKIATITQEGIVLALVALAIGGGLTLVFAHQITTPLSELAEGTAKMVAGDFSIRVKSQSKDELGRLAEAFNQMAEGLQEREWLRDMFGRFVSQEVAEIIHTRQINLEGENRVVSVLFCDIRDFTYYSERHTPKEVVAMLNAYLPLVVQAAQKHGGMVNKFGGDSALIIFGAPHKHDMQESAYQAVLTALEIYQGLKRLNQDLVKQGEAPLRIGVGINTGLALAGAVGPSERQEYTVIGNTVNLAARIDGLNKQFPNEPILISEWTYKALGQHRDEFRMASLGAVAIRGRNEPVEIWSVKGLVRSLDEPARH